MYNEDGNIIRRPVYSFVSECPFKGLVFNNLDKTFELLQFLNFLAPRPSHILFSHSCHLQGMVKDVFPSGVISDSRIIHLKILQF